MEGLRQKIQNFAIIVTVTTIFLASSVKTQNGQINTPCTASMVSSFTPCMNYITGSTANGSSPSSNCCDALKSVMSTNMDCACLLVTANVPLSLSFINRTLALSLPRFCRIAGVPLQCQATGVPLPAPGPLQFGAPPPASAFSPQASKATTATPAAEPAATEVPPVASPPVEAAAPSNTPGVRPVLTPSASSAFMISPPTISLILIGFMMVLHSTILPK